MPPERQSPLITYLVVLLGFVLGYLYNGQTDPAAAVPPIPAEFQMASLNGLDALKIDYSLLTNPQFKELKVFGQLPVQPGSGGKADPFR